MYKSLQVSGPIRHQIQAPFNGSIVIDSISIDIERSGADDAVRIYFIDKQDRYLIYKVSAKDFSVHTDANVKIEGWKNAVLDIEVDGFGRTFVGIGYTPQNVGKVKSKCIDENSIVTMYKMQAKEVKL